MMSLSYHSYLSVSFSSVGIEICGIFMMLPREAREEKGKEKLVNCNVVIQCFVISA